MIRCMAITIFAVLGALTGCVNADDSHTTARFRSPTMP